MANPIQDKIDSLKVVATQVANANVNNQIKKSHIVAIVDDVVAIGATLVSELAQNTVTDTNQTAQLVENQLVDTAQTTKDAAHDAKLAQNEVTDAGQSADIATLKVIRKDAANVFYVDRQFANQAEMIAQDAAALQGVANRPFATPFSAMKAACMYLGAGVGRKAYVVIQKGNTYSMSDYDASRHAAVIPVLENGGSRNVSIGSVLAFQNLHWRFEGSRLFGIPLLSEGACANFPLGMTASYMGEVATIGKSTNAQDDILLDIEYHIGGTQNNTGIKRLKYGTYSGRFIIGDKWQATNTGDSAKDNNYLSYHVVQLINSDIPIYINKIHNKRVLVRIDSIENAAGRIAVIGHFSAVCADGTPIGIRDSEVYVSVGSYKESIYFSEINADDAAFMYLLNSGNSVINYTLPDILTGRDRFVYNGAYPQTGITHNFNLGKVVNKPSASTRPMLELAIDGTYIFNNGTFEQNSNAPVLKISGNVKVHFRNCRFTQAQSTYMFDLGLDGKATFEHCHFYMKDGLTPIAIGTGGAIIVAKYCTSNVGATQGVTIVGTLIINSNFSI